MNKRVYSIALALILTLGGSVFAVDNTVKEIDVIKIAEQEETRLQKIATNFKEHREGEDNLIMYILDKDTVRNRKTNNIPITKKDFKTVKMTRQQIYDSDVIEGEEMSYKLGWQQEVIMEELIEVLNSVDMETKVLSSSDYVVSPTYIKSGLAYTRAMTSNGVLVDSVVVISDSIRQPLGLMPLQATKHKIRTVILHELGHVYHNYWESKGRPVLRDYTDIYLKRGIDVGSEAFKWTQLDKENFAEDFRIYHTLRLPIYNPEPIPKSTELEYSEQRIEKAFQIR